MNLNLNLVLELVLHINLIKLTKMKIKHASVQNKNYTAKDTLSRPVLVSDSQTL